MQKCYSLNTFPLKTKKNRGELPKYYYTGTHEPIIDKETFEKVQVLRKEHQNKYRLNEQKVIKKEVFNRKIYCRHCGWVFKKKWRNGELYWCCNKQGTVEEICRTPARSKEVIQKAFIKMFNTLKQNSRPVIHETLLQMQALKMKASGGKDEIMAIDQELVKLSEKNRIYSELFAQKVLDEITYYEQTDKIQNAITELRSRRLRILNDDADENCLEKLRKLERVVADTEFLTAFDDVLFIEIIDRIYVEENGEQTFCLNAVLSLRLIWRTVYENQESTAWIRNSRWANNGR